MRPMFALVCCAVLAGCSEPMDGTPIRATLDEGQVLVGEVHTGVLVLENGLGSLAIPLDDVGEVEPVEGADLAGSGDHVRVWLRNGSELVGRWAEPSLAVDIEIGGEAVDVELPMDDVQRLQLRGRSDWPDDGTFRVTTAFGDDVFIDAAETRLPLDTELGTFAPFLDECASVVLEGDRWRVELRTGTVLVGTVAADELTLALPMGPPTIDVPLADLRSIRRMHYDETAYGGSSMSAPAAADEAWYDVTPMRSQKALQK